MRRVFIALLILASLACPASAADSTVSAMSAASALTGTELLYCIQGGADRKCTAAQMSASANGVFNVRTQYGGVANGSTSNNTAINNAFTAANAYSSGNPVVYFDCDVTSTTCVYNYSGLTGGGGLSPINMTRAMTLLCAPGVRLNYTGTAHAAEIGSTSLTQADTDAYRIQNCTFTGGASYTAGLLINNWIVNLQVFDNMFLNFGNQTGYTIQFTSGGSNWEPMISRNWWRDTDGFTKNMIDGHGAFMAGFRFIDNNVECETALNAACSIVTTGVGLWIPNGFIVGNTIQFHYPLIRWADTQQQSVLWIDHNHFEGNFSGPGPAISYGDPGTAGTQFLYAHITYNYVFWPVANNTNVFIGPESASSGSHTFGNATIGGNYIADSSTLGGTGKVIQTNGTTSGPAFFFGNIYNNVAANQGTANFVDSAAQTSGLWGAYSPGTGVASQVPVFDSNGSAFKIAGFHALTKPLLCSDSSASTTAKTCTTSPQSDIGGSTFSPAAGDCFTYTSTTNNTASMTLAINGTTAATVKKTGGTANLANGDTKAGGYYPVCFDGTNYQITLGN